MSTNASDAIVRQAAVGVSRRASLWILGGAPLAAALMGSSIARAERSGKRGKKRARKKGKPKAQQKCLAQAGQCRAYFTGACGSSPDPGACEARNGPCCEFLGSCDAAGFFSCLTKASQTP
jgi:hypothetical protein